jgi:hypothetical protein
MAEKLSSDKQKNSVPLFIDSWETTIFNNLQELKSILNRITSIEAQAIEIISRLYKKKGQ